MVSVSNILLAGFALVMAVSAVPSPDVHALQKMEEYKKIVESNYTLQPRSCTDTCCSGAASCCTVNGGVWKDETSGK
ncbi:uncharacterized protein B0P05DRAFT_590533 [Gilbertella persicaria]|uniref:uncharacterized protein n=1 Tax=Gilbertella persicaria TaxID=101096 RepID=UPI00222120DE|nr:uncharacterized protein B0P05DRAFT_590533 [Gilbertella persicaria]KAI8062354.1 hypothetical protein B0P05DRAFT_590533 [Gilbertella persicaria]